MPFTRATVTKGIEKHFEEKKDELKVKLALTTYCWTALTNESYITTFLKNDPVSYQLMGVSLSKAKLTETDILSMHHLLLFTSRPVFACIVSCVSIVYN